MSDLDKSGADLQQYKVLRDTAGQGYAGVPHFCVFPFLQKLITPEAGVETVS